MDRVELHRPSSRKRPLADHLNEAMRRRDMSPAELARRTELSRKQVSELLTGNVTLTPDIAVRLEPALGTKASLLLSIDAAYRAAQKDLAAREDLAELTDWALGFPVKALVDRNHIDGDLKGADLVRALLDFFGTASYAAWEAVWPTRKLAFRRTGLGGGNAEALVTWLRLGELQAHRIDTEPFDRDGLVAWVKTMPRLTREPLTEAWSEAVKDLADVGVALVMVEEFKPLTKVNGASYWLLPHKAVVQVSSRTKRADVLWFNILHEVGHVLHDAKRAVFVANHGDTFFSPPDREAAANRFASRALVPDRLIDELLSHGVRKADIERVASEANVGPDVVAGLVAHARRQLYKLAWVNNMWRRYTPVLQDEARVAPRSRP